MPLISVIIPVFNGAKTIRDTIESVLNQTYRDFELIVINDGSTDATVAVVEAIADPRLTLLSFPNAGLSASRNRGTRHASGEFISYIDADDLWTPDKLEAQLQALQAHPNAAVAYSWTDYIDGDGRWLQAGTHTSPAGNVLAKLLMADFIENGSNVLIRRSALDAVGDFDETLKAAEDWDLFLRLAAQYEFVVVPRPQILYRRTNSMSSNVVRQETECLKVLERAYAIAPSSMRHLKKYSLANLYKYLTFKALEGPPGRRKGVEAARCLWYSVKHNPSLLKQTRVLGSVLFKITLVALLPASQSESWLSKKSS